MLELAKKGPQTFVEGCARNNISEYSDLETGPRGPWFDLLSYLLLEAALQTVWPPFLLR